MRTLSSVFAESARRFPNNTAVADPTRGSRLSYRELDSISDHIRDALVDGGVRQGDRVGLYAAKSCGSVASVLAILKAGAAYVPVDYAAPAERNAFIFNDCDVAAVMVDRNLVGKLVDAFEPPNTVTTEVGHAADLGVDLVIVWNAVTRHVERSTVGDDSLSYILYTSGSTGKPKGVMHTHSSALSFVDWCSRTFDPLETDRFSSHASFHFDLSILDLYVPLKHGAAIVLIGEDVGKNPSVLAPLIAESGITMWYSTPSILRLLSEAGKLEQHDYSGLRVVNFAGEVFPLKHLRAIKSAWPDPRYFNLYGPTETNVCTYFEVPVEIAEDRTEPYPIGFACSGDRVVAANDDGTKVPVGEPGELFVSGGSVMSGYWNLADRTASAFYIDENGVKWYRTGDIVVGDTDGCYAFVGRRDRMVKRRGYRIELGEIEAALYRHENVSEVAVVALPDEENGVRITAFLCTNDGKAIGLIAMKRYCSGMLPLYMIPDSFNYSEYLPKTSTDKIDYQTLLQSA
jgi:amino acid adenylation domain-containing protein